ncbi:MAG TPA: preprotein translocase subunit SecE [Candidatus Paceibacterota bacterium]
MAKLGFLRQTRNEMRHVVWPSRARTVAYTLIIIGLSLALGYFLSGVDSVFRAGLRALI